MLNFIIIIKIKLTIYYYFIFFNFNYIQNECEIIFFTVEMTWLCNVLNVYSYC